MLDQCIYEIPIHAYSVVTNLLPRFLERAVFTDEEARIHESEDDELRCLLIPVVAMAKIYAVSGILGHDCLE